jgi:hypothetical protein
MHCGVAQVYHITKDKDGKEGKRDKGKEHVITDGRDNYIPVVPLVFFKESLDDVPEIMNCLLNPFFINSLFHRSPGYCSTMRQDRKNKKRDLVNSY